MNDFSFKRRAFPRPLQAQARVTANQARHTLTYVCHIEYSGHMRRTTVRLDEGLLRQAKAEARRQGESVTALIERGLRLILSGSHHRGRRTRVRLPVSRATGGTRPGVDLNDSRALLDRLEGR